MACLALGPGGCASLSPDAQGIDGREHEQTHGGTLPGGAGWWFARFHIDWPEGEPARWYMGTLIGAEIIAPIFDEYYRDVLVWRVHRRAARDGGHVFSFIFYSSPEGAQRIYQAIENHAVVNSLLENGRLIRVAVDDVTRITRPDIQDTSDESWPESVQQTWPAMIMGASRMWLDLVSLLAARESSIGGIEAKYRKVQDEVTRIWEQEGQHAMLHHLNAVYAYQPLLIRY
jgi:hypothetical protein